MRRIITIISLFFYPLLSNAQHICGFDEVHQVHFDRDMNYRARFYEYEQQLNDIINKNKQQSARLRTAEALVKIPVVVHIVHTGGDVGTIYNPTDQQIIEAINYVNKVYAGEFSWVEGVKNLNIQFELAKRDPNCNPTTGIMRVNASSNTDYTNEGIRSSGSLGAPELSVKNLSRWNPADYYNIWVVNKIDGKDGTSGQFVAGYAYLPGTASSLVDGTVALASQTKSGNDLLVHELGHALALLHPFQGSSNSTNCPPNNNCLIDGDGVCDTDPITYNVTNGVVNFTCRTGNLNPCTGTQYTVNTEKNFMSYTTCTSLFTQGQKERMRAALELPSRASLIVSKGAMPTFMSPACPPTINFDLSSISVIESTEATEGCRGYKDHLIKMNITSAPSESLNLTFNSAGNAIKGIDYDLFADKNASVPTITMSFPAGLYDSKEIKVRIYDDASVEGDKVASIGFSVNGGGSGVGAVIPNFDVFIRDNDTPPITPGTVNQIAVGANNTTLSTNSPFRGGKIRNRLQVLITASELINAGIKAGTISGLNIRILTKNSTTVYRSFAISMGLTTSSQLTTSGGFISGLTNVRAGADYTSVQGINTFNFANPFVWDGTRNIVVEFCYGNAASQISSNDVVEGTTSPLGSTLRASLVSDYLSGSTSACSLNAATSFESRPLIQFIVPAASNPVATAISSSENYLGPNADAYFYGSNGTILARIVNTSSFDYGCTTVDIDRVGNGTVPFWNTAPQNQLTQKTFKVTTQNINPNGTYQIGLYFSNAEKAEYERLTGLNWSTVQMVKSNGSIASITPGNQQPSTVTVNSNAAKSVFGSDHVVIASFNNGFSGFAVGSPGTATSVFDYQVLKGVKIYPNPVSKQINIGFEKLQRNVSIRMMSADGRVLYTQRINGTVQNHSVIVDKLNQGIYLLEINSDEGKKTIPVIKQ